jgi:hypothetical protein
MASTSPITPERVSAMVEHWLGCPPGGYLGSDYGADVKSLLQTPLASSLADDLVRKCNVDVPLSAGLAGGGLTVYAYDIDFDKKGLVFEIAGRQIGVESTQ